MRKNGKDVVCQGCGEVYYVALGRLKETKYCSLSCHGRSVLGRPEIQAKIRRRYGAENNRWKGGRRKHTQGYVWILVNGKYYLEHRYIMMQSLKRPLAKGEQVHHKNGNKLDNRIENLELVNVADHIRQHHKEGLYKPCGWSRNFYACKSCGTTEKPHSAQGYCRPCYRKNV